MSECHWNGCYNLLQPSYWCGTKQESGLKLHGSRVSVKEVKDNNSDFFESEPVNSVAGIQIQGLTKKFKAKGQNKVQMRSSLTLW